MHAPSTGSLLKQIQEAARHLRNGRRDEAFRVYELVAKQSPAEGAAQEASIVPVYRRELSSFPVPPPYRPAGNWEERSAVVLSRE